MDKKNFDLANRTLKAKLTIGMMGKTRVDKEASKVVQDAFNNNGSGRYTKELGKGFPELEAIASVGHDTAMWFDTLGVPLTDKSGIGRNADRGWRLVKSERFFDIKLKSNQFKTKFEDAVNAFCQADVYDRFIEYEKDVHKALFKIGDYPHNVTEARHKFYYDLYIRRNDGSESDLFGMTQQAIDDIKKEEREHTARALSSAVDNVKDMIADSLKTVKNALANGKRLVDGSHKGTFRNLQELCNNLGNLNIADDVGIDRMRTDILNNVLAYSIEDLRDRPAFRSTCVSHIDNILAQIRTVPVISSTPEEDMVYGDTSGDGTVTMDRSPEIKDDEPLKIPDGSSVTVRIMPPANPPAPLLVHELPEEVQLEATLYEIDKIKEDGEDELDKDYAAEKLKQDKEEADRILAEYKRREEERKASEPEVTEDSSDWWA